jgi:BolA protein
MNDPTMNSPTNEPTSELNQRRIAAIRARLEAALEPTELEVIDDSLRHRGHAGARDGKGHFIVRIVSPRFAGLSPLARHREVYGALGDLLETDIHAVNIEARTPR